MAEKPPDWEELDLTPLQRKLKTLAAGLRTLAANEVKVATAKIDAAKAFQKANLKALGIEDKDGNA